MATSSAELLQAEAELVRHSLGYLKSMALHSAVKLGIPDALHGCGGAASLPDLSSALALPCSKRPYLSRLMKMLAVDGIFTAVSVDVPTVGEGAGTVPSVRYGLNPVSRHLVSCSGACLSPCVLMGTSPLFLEASLRLPQWFQRDVEGEGEPAFAVAHGESPYGAAGRDMEFNALINEAMGSDSRYMAELVVRECGEVFTGVTSLVDVGGGNGTMATAIAKAFPHVKCSVLDLPHVIQGVSAHESVEFAAGDMMEYVPPADAVLLKCVLHNWSDEDCVKILTKCREAITQGAKAGKVIIIDAVVGSPSHSQQVLEAQVLMDMQMMMLFMSKEREELNWQKIFMEAGFSHYKIQPILGMRSIIELYP